MDQHLLSIILFTPLAGVAVLLFLPGKSKDLIRIWANLVGFAGFLISLPLLSRLRNGTPGFQFEERFVCLDEIAVFFQPAGQGALRDGFAHRRYLDVDCHVRTL